MTLTVSNIVISFMKEYRKRESWDFFFFFFFTIPKTISTRAHIAVDKLPMLICMVSCVEGGCVRTKQVSDGAIAPSSPALAPPLVFW